MFAGIIAVIVGRFYLHQNGHIFFKLKLKKFLGKKFSNFSPTATYPKIVVRIKIRTPMLTLDNVNYGIPKFRADFLEYWFREPSDVAHGFGFFQTSNNLLVCKLFSFWL